ncbi:MAG TPA: hypothetical protein VGH19_21540 [Verrucomicrobiae bacterium]
MRTFTRNICLQAIFTLCAVMPLQAAEAPVNLQTELVKISAQPNATERLAAYDALAAKAAKLSQEKKKQEITGKTVTKHGNWTLYASISPIDDKQIYTAVVEADQTVRVGFRDIRPRLVIALKDGKRLSAYVDYDYYLGYETIDVTVRYGTEKAKTERWSLSDDHQAAYPAMGSNTFLTKLKKTDKMLVRLAPESENSIIVTFTLEGVNEFADTILTEWKKW